MTDDHDDDSWAVLNVLTSEQRVLKSVTLVPSELYKHKKIEEVIISL